MSIEIEYRLPTVSEFRALRGETDWGIPSQRETETVLKHSYSGVVVTDAGNAIAMARSVGDGCLILYIQDVIVTSSYRSRGIGRILMRSLIQQASKSCSPDCTIGLFAAKGQTGFYKKLGFGKRNKATYGPGMHGTLSTLAKASSAA